MINRGFRINTRFLLLSLILAYSIMPIVSRTISTYLTTYAYMLLVVWIMFTIICGGFMTSINRYVSVLFPFILFQLLTYLTRSDSIVMWGYKVLLFLLPLTVGYYIVYERTVYLNDLSRISCIFLIITLATTIRGLIVYPFASRILATVNSQDAESMLFDWNNIGGYNFIYTLVLLYPLLILAFKQKKLSTIPMATLSLLIGYVIFLSEYTTALLLFAVSSILLLFRRELTVQNMVTFSVFTILFVSLFDSLFSNLLLRIAGSIDSTVLQERLTALAGGTAGLEASESNRIFLYRYSIDTFLGNPIFGTMFSGGRGSGGHAQILDTLAIYGLVGGSLMLWMYRTIYELFLKPFKNAPGFGYVLWFFVQTLFLSTINTGFWFEVLALYGPLILYIIYLKDEPNENTVDRKYPARPIRRGPVR